MKHLFRTAFAIVALVCLELMTTSCNEEIREVVVYDTIRDTVYVDQKGLTEVACFECDALLETAYSRWLAAMYNNQGHAHTVQTFVADLTMLPTRGADWFDDGKWVQTHQHDWFDTHKHVEEAWNDFMNGLSESTAALVAYEATEFPEQEKIGQAKAMVGFHLYNLIDLFGKAPYTSGGSVVILEGQNAVDEIETLFREAMGHMDEVNSIPGNSARFTKAGVWTMLAKLYLNKSVFVDRYGTPSFDPADMDTVYKYTSKVIDLGAYAVESDYFRMFDADNAYNSEFILVVEQFSTDDRSFGRNDLAGNQIGRNQRFDSEVRGSNGGCISPDFYAMWDQTDPRFFERHIADEEGTIAPDVYTSINRGILSGQQYGPVLNEDGSAFVTDDSGNFVVEALVMDKDNTVNMNFTPEVTDITGGETGLLNQGARISKYQMDVIGGRSSGGFDIPLIRISDVYLLRAEATLRGATTSTVGADADVNQVRTARAGDSNSGTSTLSSLSGVTLDQLLDERAFELYWEPHRRSDLIRFSKWEDAWTAKTSSNVDKRLFPIYADGLDDFGSFGLTQNRGY